MTEVATAADGETPKKGKKGLYIGAIVPLALGVAAFFVTYTGVFPSASRDSNIATGAHDSSVTDDHGASIEDGNSETASGVKFVDLEPLVITLGNFASSRHLRFHAYLEVPPESASEVEHLRPRILDVLNTYLRAISENDLEDPASMNQIRAQMLRRVQIVVGVENVRDLLITEFVLS